MGKIVQAAGVVVMTRETPTKVLLLKHADRLDLPKGHMDEGEDLLQTALRETSEETGLPAEQLTLEPDFKFQIEYDLTSRKRGSYRKRVTYFLGWVDAEFEVALTEHIGFEWVRFPCRPIQAETLDPLFEEIERHLLS